MGILWSFCSRSSEDSDDIGVDTINMGDRVWGTENTPFYDESVKPNRILIEKAKTERGEEYQFFRALALCNLCKVGDQMDEKTGETTYYYRGSRTGKKLANVAKKGGVVLSGYSEERGVKEILVGNEGNKEFYQFLSSSSGFLSNKSKKLTTIFVEIGFHGRIKKSKEGDDSDDDEEEGEDEEGDYIVTCCGPPGYIIPRCVNSTESVKTFVKMNTETVENGAFVDGEDDRFVAVAQKNISPRDWDDHYQGRIKEAMVKKGNSRILDREKLEKMFEEFVERDLEIIGCIKIEF